MTRIKRHIWQMTHQIRTMAFGIALVLILMTLFPAFSEKKCIYGAEDETENFDSAEDEADGDSGNEENVSELSVQVDEFSGSRTLSFSAIPSDLENFVNGGRTAFDMILRKSSPEWLNYSFLTDEGVIALTLEFSFDSLEDYKGKLEELLGKAPSIVYLDEEMLFLMEGHGAYDLLTYFEEELLELDSLSERTLAEIFTISENTMTLNGVTYAFEDRVEIRGNGSEIIRADAISIDTEMDENGKYTRTVTAWLDQSTTENSQIEAIEKQFAESGATESTEEEGYAKISVTFSAAAIEDLAANTMLCLNVADSVAETVAYKDEETVLVSYTEFLDAEEILKDGGTLSYSLSFPDYVSDVETDNVDGIVTDRTVTAEYVAADTAAEDAGSETEDEITGFSAGISYQRAPNFTGLTVDTDFSSILGKITRTITFEMPLELAEYYHDSLKENMTERLIQGVTLDIYDQDEVRYYRFTYSAWFLEDVQEFTKAILGKGNELEYEDSWIPFAGGEISDSISVAGVAKNMSPTEEIVLSYTVSNLRNVSEVIRGSSSAVVTGHMVSFAVDDGDRVSFEYTGLNLVRGCLLLLAFVLVLTLLLRIVFAIRKTVKKRRAGQGE